MRWPFTEVLHCVFLLHQLEAVFYLYVGIFCFGFGFPFNTGAYKIHCVLGILAPNFLNINLFSFHKHLMK